MTGTALHIACHQANPWLVEVAESVRVSKIGKFCKLLQILQIEPCKVCPLSVYRSPRCVFHKALVWSWIQKLALHVLFDDDDFDLS